MAKRKTRFKIKFCDRHPGSNALDFCEKLNATLSNLNKSYKKFLILEHLNLSTTRMQPAPSCQRLFEHTVEQCSFSPYH